ncbi:hypothetical protein G6F37_006845 [Rhizopus arrhizus]|nr:hypothetical protein G6F38_005566 [Rhizopus arrhizus]KAG1157278.1 hypothetical protein G6F37_006845 [Rhizopus arrhizus]
MGILCKAAPNNKNANSLLAKNKDYKPNAKNAIQKALAKYHRHRFASSFFNPTSGNGIGYAPIIDYYNDIETSAKDSRAWSISYDDGSSTSGILGTDTVVLGGLTIQRQTIELARREASIFQNGSLDGLLGLSFNFITTVRGVKALVDNLINQVLISNPVFDVYLGKESNGDGDEYIFGDYKSSKFKGFLTAIPVDNSNGWYGVIICSASIGRSHIASSFDATLDTSPSLLVLPNDVARSVVSAYGARDNYDGTFSISCDTSRFQPLVFIIGSSTFEVPAGSLVYEQDGYSGVTSFSYGDYDFATFDDILKSSYIVFNLVTSLNVLLDEWLITEKYGCVSY